MYKAINMRFKKLTRTLGLAMMLSMAFGALKAQNNFEIPSNWAGADAIISNQTSLFSYIPKNKGKDLEIAHQEKINVIINSKTGGADFKNIYLPKGYSIEVVVNKADGGGDDYDEDDAKDLNVKDVIPYFFKEIFKNYTEFEKINVGTLDKGDELEISYSISETESLKSFMGGSACKAFPKQVITFPTLYPKGGHNVTIKTGPTMHLNYGSMNNGPSASVESGLEADTFVVEIKAGQSDAILKQLFTYPARTYATSKFEVVVCAKYKEGATSMVLGNPGEVNEEYSSDELKLAVFNKQAEWAANGKYSKAVSAFIGEIKAKTTPDWLKQVYEGFQSYAFNTGLIENYNDDVFIGVMTALILEKGLEYDVIVGVDRRSSTIDDMILNGEILYGLKVKDKKEDFFVFPFSRFSSWNDKTPMLLGEEVYMFTPGKKLEECAFEDNDMPESLPADNQRAVRTTLKLGDGFTALIVNETFSLSGITKTEEAVRAVSIPEYHKATLDKAKYAQYANQRDEDEAEDFKNRRKDIYEMEARSLFDTVEYQRFSLTTTGFEPDDNWLKINEKYTIPGSDVVKFQIKDSMRVYTVSLGPFVETPYKLSKTSSVRNGDVFIDYPCIIDYRVRFEIPDGYAIFGFDQFDADYNTDFASFKSKAEPNGKELEIKTSLVLKKTHITENEWMQLMTMLSKFEGLDKVKVTMAGN